MKMNVNGTLKPKKDSNDFFFWFFSSMMAASLFLLVGYILYMILAG